MHFRTENVAAFIGIFEESRLKIAGFEGCHQVELLRDKRQPDIFFTYSLWESEVYLEQYRQSELFKGVWARTKALFAEKAQAWSVEELNF